MIISIEQYGWENENPEDIHCLLNNVLNHLICHLDQIPCGVITVRPGDTFYPEVKYRASPSADYVVCLSARGRAWAQYSYQFAHELCHILSGYERLRSPENGWLHESLCELASLFVIRQMASSWARTPPYQNWALYSSALSAYADDIIEELRSNSKPCKSFHEWILEHEEHLRADRYDRLLNRLVAVRLLPFFESNPLLWRTIAYLPDSSACLDRYLLEWELSSPADLQSSVREIGRLFIE